MNMELPKIKKKKLIGGRKFEELAKRVRKSFEEEAKYIQQQKQNGSSISTNSHSLS